MDTMLLSNCLVVTLAVIVFWWPISYLLNCFFYKKRVLKITRNIPSIDDYPLLGCALRFLGKNNEGVHLENSFLFILFEIDSVCFILFKLVNRN